MSSREPEKRAALVRLEAVVHRRRRLYLAVIGVVGGVGAGVVNATLDSHPHAVAVGVASGAIAVCIVGYRLRLLDRRGY